MKKPILALLSAVLTLLAVSCGTVSYRKSTGGGYMHSGYSKAALEKMGVNTQHLFVFTEQRATYNGRKFSIKHPVDSLIPVFGPDYRILTGTEHNAGYDHYFWDNIGFVALVSPEREVLEWCLHWEYLPKVAEYDYDDPDPTLVPAEFFKGKILLNGIPLDNTSDYAAYCNDRKVQSRLRKMAQEYGIENYAVCLYYYQPMTINRYQHTYHDLYLFDYSEFGAQTRFSYRMKIATKTGKMHEMGMQYGIYKNPDAIELF